MTDQTVSSANGILDEAAAAEAWALARPSIDAALARDGVSGERVLHVVVLDPQVRIGDGPFDRAILFEASVGDPETWGADYRAFARGKAELSWRLGCDTHLVQELRPHLLRPGDSLLWGGVWRDGLVVACSGAHAWFDEAFAQTVAAFLIAIAHERARAAREKGLTLPGS